MRVCIPSFDPGGPDGIASKSFEDTEVFDFYELLPDRNFKLVAQTRPCMCWGPDQAEAISRRSVDAIIVADISPSAFLKLATSGVKVLKVDNTSVAALLDSYAAGMLEEIRINEFAKLGKVKQRD